MQLFPKTHFDFLGLRWKFFALSGLLLGGSVVSLMTRGVKYGIDFTGGTVVTVTFEKPLELSRLRYAAAQAGMQDPGLQQFTGTNTFVIRIQSDVKQSAELIESQLTAIQGVVGSENKLRIDNKEYVGPAVGRYLFRQALLAICLSLTLIILYLGFKFKDLIWGVAGVIALFHDVLATYGFFSILGAEVDLLIISAILTIGGYSIHDTIVIFDRMREKGKIMRKDPLGQVMNESMNETLSRTIITSGTVLVVVSILYFFGGKVIHHFAMAMVFGTIVGTYSSIAVAAPLVYEWNLRLTRQNRPQSVPPPTSRPKPATQPRLK
ncbi:MAG: protein translocase subunit SecF [Elusimicrobia bacterium]|nr:protein translocase subunit SecF [Elusimicrobiota bacterium]